MILAVLTSDKTDFKLKLVRTDKEGHFILIKGTIYQEEIKIVSIYSPNVDMSNFIKQTLMDMQVDPNTIRVKDFNIPLSNR
jgi:hypothetical protein